MIRVGSDDFYESRLIAEIYAQVLEDEGHRVERLLGLGTRQERVPALEQGEVDLVPEYVGSGLGFYDTSQITGDGEENAERLQAILEPLQITVLDITPGEDTNTAVRRGLQHTGRIITTAALLMLIVFGAFGFAQISDIEQIGVGLFVAVLVDATIVRCLLVPATMTMLGRWNWWAPAPLRRLHRRVGLSEAPVSPAVTAEPATSGTGDGRA